MAHIQGIRYSLPDRRRTNRDLVHLNPTWDAEKILNKTGIHSRHVVGVGETAADLGKRAAESLLMELDFDRRRVDALLFCTESPDHPLPPNACLLQNELGLPNQCAAFDYNLGCSGFTYGLWLAKSLIAAGEVECVLLIVGDTYSKYCAIDDLATATIFGDGAAATLITADEERAIARIGPSVLGTDGKGAEYLIVREGGARTAGAQQACTSHPQLHMNGPAVYAFTLQAVATAVDQLLAKVGLPKESIDHFLLHQANGFMLEQLRRKLDVGEEKMPIDIEDLGNTVSATIPILIRRCEEHSRFRRGDKCVLAGFGVGFSWAITYLEWLADRSSESVVQR